jgi:hypothetical protein
MNFSLKLANLLRFALYIWSNGYSWRFSALCFSLFRLL